MKEIILNGEAGRLESRYCHSKEKRAPIALVLHPHPLHGGTMNNKVVYNTCKAFIKNKFSVLRFNFRGVGKSLGVFDNGVGELIDSATALDWLQANNPEASSCWVAGFSFGAWIALQLLMRRPEINGFIAISPPVSSYEFNFFSPCVTQGLILQGSDDEIVNEQAVYEFYEKISKQKNSEIEYSYIDKADHFYKGKLDQLRELIEAYVKPRMHAQQQVRKIRRDRRRRQHIPVE